MLEVCDNVLDQLEAHSARKTIGFETAPDGNINDEFKDMKDLMEG
jgi:hypothetical protein